MSTFTKNINMEKPDPSDFYDVGVHCENIEKIDKEFGKTIPISKGGTGSGTVAGALKNLGLYTPVNLLKLHYWSKHEGKPSIIETERENLIISSKNSASISSPYSYVEYADSMQFRNGKIKLVNPSIVLVSSTNKCDILTGKYIHEHKTGRYYKVHSDSVGKETTVGTTTTYELTKTTELTVENEKIGYVVSEQSDKYPLYGSSNGYWYEYCGQIGDK